MRLVAMPSFRSTAFFGLVCLIGATPRYAQAVYVGTIFSGPTAKDPFAVYWNPAAMVQMTGTHGILFSTITPVQLSYQRDVPSPHDGQPYPEANTLVMGTNPAAALVTDATLKRFRFGIGVALPIADGASWDDTVDGRPASTRYYALEALDVQFNIGLTAAYRVNRYLSVGVGLDIIGIWQKLDSMIDFGAKINQVICSRAGSSSCPINAPFAREDPVNQGVASAGGVGVSAGVVAGILIEPFPWLRFGVGFHSGAPVKVPVELSVEIPEAVKRYVEKNLPSVKLPALEAELEMHAKAPMIVTAGVAVSPWKPLELTADLHWIDKSATEVLRIFVRNTTTSMISDQVTAKGRRDGYLFGLGGIYTINERWRVTARVEFSPSSRPSEYLCPTSLDFDRLSLQAGVAWRFLRWATLTFEYGFYHIWDRIITRSYYAPNAQPSTPEEAAYDLPPASGTYSVSVNRFGIGLLFHME